MVDLPFLKWFYEIEWEYIYIYICFDIVSVELEKQSYCDLKVANKTEDYVAFKVNFICFLSFFIMILPSLTSFFFFFD